MLYIHSYIHFFDNAKPAPPNHPVITNPRHVIGGFAAVAVAFVANLQSKPQYLTYFALYFAGVRYNSWVDPSVCAVVELALVVG